MRLQRTIETTTIATTPLRSAVSATVLTGLTRIVLHCLVYNSHKPFSGPPCSEADINSRTVSLLLPELVP